MTIHFLQLEAAPKAREPSKRRVGRTPPLVPGHRPIRGLHCEPSQHGQERWSYRVGKGKRIWLKDAAGRYLLPGTSAFQEALDRARYGISAPATASAAPKLDYPHSLQWLVDRFLASNTFLTNQKTGAPKSPATMSAYRYTYARVCRVNGSVDCRAIDRAWMQALYDKIAAGANGEPTVALANASLKHLTLLFDYAVDAEILQSNPCAKVATRGWKSEPHLRWLGEHLEAFEARWAPGTRERAAYELLLGTGQRCSDVCRMGRHHIRDRIMTLVQKKTGKEVEIPWTARLRETIDEGQIGQPFVMGAHGRALKADSFSSWFNAACRAAGLTDRTAHGLRHTAACLDAEAGKEFGFLLRKFGFSAEIANRYVSQAKGKQMMLRSLEEEDEAA
jgi:integrase